MKRVYALVASLSVLAVAVLIFAGVFRPADAARKPPGPPSNTPPVFDYVTGPSQVGVSVSGTWNAKATDLNGDFLTYTFNWGDSSTSSVVGASSSVEVSASHTYYNEGTYIILVTVSDGRGGFDSASTSVSVSSST